MAFYTEPRFTRDIGLLVDSEDFEKTKGILEKDGYFESASSRTFRNVVIELHRFLKVVRHVFLIFAPSLAAGALWAIFPEGRNNEKKIKHGTADPNIQPQC